MRSINRVRLIRQLTIDFEQFDKEHVPLKEATKRLTFELKRRGMSATTIRDYLACAQARVGLDKNEN